MSGIPPLEPVELRDGTTVQASLNGWSLDGQQAYAMLCPPTGTKSLQAFLEAGKIIRVERNSRGNWQEMDELEEDFIGGRVGDKWYCPMCLDIRFTHIVADRLMKGRPIIIGSIELEAVDTKDAWVQDKACADCHERFDTEP